MIINFLIGTISFAFVAFVYCASFALCIHLHDENKKLKEKIVRYNEEIRSGEYAKEHGKCPMCMDCPDNCPLDKEKSNGI